MAIRFLGLTSCLGAALAACGAQPPIVPGGAALARLNPLSRTHYKIVYQFPVIAGGKDYYKGPVTDVNDTLYGTTAGGGKSHNGIVYGLTASGQLNTLHTFAGGSADGAHPTAALISVNGTLYGTTTSGGQCGNGTVYSITTSGSETVLHSFCGTDGESPAGLTDVAGTLYGTAALGGASSKGTVYRISTIGKFKVLYAFGSRPYDALQPDSPPLEVNGALYGTTGRGGDDTYCGEHSGHTGCGAVYHLTLAGKEKVVYSFQAGNDGWWPAGGLTYADGTLYGVTIWGGKSHRGVCCGTVYSLSTSGNHTVLYRFQSTSTGLYPETIPVEMNGLLYGTTSVGGSGGRHRRQGTIFSVPVGGGSEQVLHSFTGRPDGADPVAMLTDVNGTLYGTTVKGGQCTGKFHGCGILFSIRP